MASTIENNANHFNSVISELNTNANATTCNVGMTVVVRNNLGDSKTTILQNATTFTDNSNLTMGMAPSVSSSASVNHGVQAMNFRTGATQVSNRLAQGDDGNMSKMVNKTPVPRMTKVYVKSNGAPLDKIKFANLAAPLRPATILRGDTLGATPVLPEGQNVLEEMKKRVSNVLLQQVLTAPQIGVTNPKASCVPGTNCEYRTPGANYKNKNGRVKRPMNAFMVWARDFRGRLAQAMPNATNSEISVTLGRVWASLKPQDKKKYYATAERIKAKHRQDFPDWVYQPAAGRKDGSPKSFPSPSDHGSDISLLEMSELFGSDDLPISNSSSSLGSTASSEAGCTAPLQPQTVTVAPPTYTVPVNTATQPVETMYPPNMAPANVQQIADKRIPVYLQRVTYKPPPRDIAGSGHVSTYTKGMLANRLAMDMQNTAGPRSDILLTPTLQRAIANHAIRVPSVGPGLIPTTLKTGIQEAQHRVNNMQPVLPKPPQHTLPIGIKTEKVSLDEIGAGCYKASGRMSTVPMVRGQIGPRSANRPAAAPNIEQTTTLSNNTMVPSTADKSSKVCRASTQNGQSERKDSLMDTLKDTVSKQVNPCVPTTDNSARLIQLDTNAQNSTPQNFSTKQEALDDDSIGASVIVTNQCISDITTGYTLPSSIYRHPYKPYVQDESWPFPFSQNPDDWDMESDVDGPLTELFEEKDYLMMTSDSLSDEFPGRLHLDIDRWKRFLDSDDDDAETMSKLGEDHNDEDSNISPVPLRLTLQKRLNAKVQVSDTGDIITGDLLTQFSKEDQKDIVELESVENIAGIKVNLSVEQAEEITSALADMLKKDGVVKQTVENVNEQIRDIVGEEVNIDTNENAPKIDVSEQPKSFDQQAANQETTLPYNTTEDTTTRSHVSNKHIPMAQAQTKRTTASKVNESTKDNVTVKSEIPTDTVDDHETSDIESQQRTIQPSVCSQQTETIDQHAAKELEIKKETISEISQTERIIHKKQNEEDGKRCSTAERNRTRKAMKQGSQATEVQKQTTKACEMNESSKQGETTKVCAISGNVTPRKDDDDKLNTGDEIITVIKKSAKRGGKKQTRTTAKASKNAK